MSFVFYFLVMILIFGVLIFIHELGHFVTARLCGVSIKEFAIGMGPTLVSWNSKKYETRYAIRLLPIGGFVSMVGEDEESDSKDAFCNKSVFKRALIVIMGPLMNFVLGFLIMMVFVFSQPNLVSTTIAQFDDNAISNEKLMVGDTVVKVEGTNVHTANDLLYEVMNKGYREVDLTVIRDNEKILLEDVEFPTFVENGTTFGNCDFKLYIEESNFANYFKHSFYRSCSTVKMVVDSLVGLLTGRYGLNSVSGPIGVADVVGDVAKANFLNIFYIVSVLSINLGVFNLIPFPALDGGRLLFLVIEAIRRKPINKNVESYINFIGIMLLFGLMIVVTFKDIIKLIL